MELEDILESVEIRSNIELIDRMIEENNNTDSIGDTTLRFRDAVWLDEIQNPIFLLLVLVV